jgi:hypothetical protein
MDDNDFASHEDLGALLAEAIGDLEAQRKFAGDMECVFVVPVEGGGEYEVTVRRVETTEGGRDAG